MIRTVGAWTVAVWAGGAPADREVRAAFPTAGVAAPWRLAGEVWSGSFAEAVPGLGDDADAWAPHAPTRVWLAKYTHEDHAERTLTVRCFAFESVEYARAAYEVFRPVLAKPLHSGDVGCWTEIGVLFQRGRLVFEIFGDDMSWNSQVQSAVLAAILVKRLPPGVADNPQ